MRQECALHTDVCAIDGSLVVRHTGRGLRVPGRIRDPYYSHNVLRGKVYPRRSVRGAPAPLDTRLAPPLVWVPTWLENFSEQMLHGVLPLYELVGANRTNHRLILDTRSSRALPAFVHRLLTPFSVHPVSTLASTRACFTHLRFCKFYSTSFDGPYHSRIWEAAQFVADFYAPRPPPTSEPHIVIDVKSNRRRLTNVRDIVRWCALAHRSCVSHDFATAAFNDSVALMRRTRILLGMHGAGLANAHFMPRPNVLIEVRPYAFEGAWPNLYYHDILHNASMFMHIGVSERRDCAPTQNLGARPVDGWNTDCTVSVDAVAQAIRNAKEFLAQPEAYARAPAPAKELTSYPRVDAAVGATRPV